MKRTILNMLALTVILGGASHLNAQTALYCCSGDTASCCGQSGCSLDKTGCHAW